VKPKWFACVLSERVTLKHNIGRMFSFHDTRFPSPVLAVVNVFWILQA